MNLLNRLRQPVYETVSGSHVRRLWAGHEEDMAQAADEIEHLQRCLLDATRCWNEAANEVQHLREMNPLTATPGPEVPARFDDEVS